MGKRVITNEVLQQYQEHLCMADRRTYGRLEITASKKATKTLNHPRQTCSHMHFTNV